MLGTWSILRLCSGIGETETANRVAQKTAASPKGWKPNRPRVTERRLWLEVRQMFPSFSVAIFSKFQIAT